MSPALPTRQFWFWNPTVKGGVSTTIPLDQYQKSDTVKNVNNDNTTQTQMKTYLLATAILAQIAQFHASKANFSAHEVTQGVRAKLADGDWDISDLPKDTIGGNYVAIVPHDKVRDFVTQLMELELIPDYKGENYFNPVRGVSYILYKHANAAPTITIPTPAATAPSTNFITGFLPSAALPIPVGRVSLAPAAPIGTNLKSPDSDMWDKVVTYVSNQRSLARTPTLKQVQSRLKGYAVSCSELEQFFIQRNYRLLRPSRNLSQAQVL